MATVERIYQTEITTEKLLTRLVRYVLDASDCVDLDRYEPYVDMVRRAFAPSLEHRLIEALEHLSREDPDDAGNGDVSTKTSLLCDLQAWIESTGATNGLSWGQDASRLGALLNDALLVSGRLERIGKQLGRLDIQCARGSGQVVDSDAVQAGDTSTPDESGDQIVGDQNVNGDNPEQLPESAENGEIVTAKEAPSSENPIEDGKEKDCDGQALADAAAANDAEPELKSAKVRLVITEVCQNKSRQRVDCLKIPCDPRVLERKILKNLEPEQPLDSNNLGKLRKSVEGLCVCLNKLTKQMNKESVENLVLHCRVRKSSLCLKVIRQDSNICMLASRVTLMDCTKKKRRFFRLFASKSDPSPCPCNVELCNESNDKISDKSAWNEGSESFGTSGERSASCDEFLSAICKVSEDRRISEVEVSDNRDGLVTRESRDRNLPSRTRNRPLRGCPCEVEEINDKFDVVCLSRSCGGRRPGSKVVCSCHREGVTSTSSSQPTTCTSSNENHSESMSSNEVARGPVVCYQRVKKGDKNVDLFSSLSAYKQKRKCIKFDPYSLSISRESEEEVAICDRMYCEDYPCDDDEFVAPCLASNKKSVSVGMSNDRVQKVQQKSNKNKTRIEYCKDNSRIPVKNGKAITRDRENRAESKDVEVVEKDVKDRDIDLRDACTSTGCLQVATAVEVKHQEAGNNEAEECDSTELTNIYINEISLCYCSKPDSKHDASTNTEDHVEEPQQEKQEEFLEEEKIVVDAGTSPDEMKVEEKVDNSTQACMKAVLFCACSNKSPDDDVAEGDGSQEISEPNVTPEPSVSVELCNRHTMTDPALLLLSEIRSNRDCLEDIEELEEDSARMDEPADHVGTIKSKIREIVQLNERMREQVAQITCGARIEEPICSTVVTSCSIAVQATVDCNKTENRVDVQLQIDEVECPEGTNAVGTQTPRKCYGDEFEVLQKQYSDIMRRGRALHLLSCSESGPEMNGTRLRLTLSTNPSYKCAGSTTNAAGDQTREGSLRTTCRCSRRANLLEYLSERLSRDGLERLKRLLRLLLKKLMEKGHELRKGWRNRRPTSCCQRCCCCNQCSRANKRPSPAETRTTVPPPCVFCDCKRPRGSARLAGGAGGDADHPNSSHPTVRTRSRYKTRRTRHQRHRDHPQVGATTGVRSSLDLAELEARRVRIRAFTSRWSGDRPRTHVDLYDPSIASLPLSRSWRYS
ncbi:hypothetical protein QAD02_017044 [Eretmocerus hayati]|uniref:Uncharacterized protein n=1 Tax=Eretmocerus hayati TaxID=131215 RepID=A0ACC2PCS3_9HYME|nr:hypothetical protein QAD02_017044 [Eretmocerus hayati]